ncbi:MAG: methionine synthase I (cobalamin-dependent) [Candidatus Latescibacterota bacterium]|jgi:methionine synthase I (cobalamin-dependent)
MKAFIDRLKDDNPMVYDGGFGSQLFARGVNLTNSALANESHPDAVVSVHRAYIDAGADAIGTNTFVVSPLHLKMAGGDADDAERLAKLGAQHARRAVEDSGREVYVAGSIGPSPGAIEADAGDTVFGIANEDAIEAHRRVIGALADGGVDFFVVETQFSAKEAAMVVNLTRETGLPVAVNMTYKFTQDRKTGQLIYKTDWGFSPGDLLDLLAGGEFSNGDSLIDHVHLLGLNCGAETRNTDHTGMPYAIEGTRQMRDALVERGIEGKRLMAYPNAGLPLLDKVTKLPIYSQGPEEMAPHMGALLDVGGFLIGGCCGTEPEHIAAFRKAMDEK